MVPLMVIVAHQMSRDDVDSDIDVVDFFHDFWRDDVCRSALIGELAFVHDDDFIGIAGGKIDVVKDDDNGFAKLACGVTLRFKWPPSFMACAALIIKFISTCCNSILLMWTGGRAFKSVLMVTLDLAKEFCTNTKQSSIPHEFAKSYI